MTSRKGISWGSRTTGWSLVEILVALTIFSLATVGLYLAMQGMNEAMMTAMHRNIEAAYVNMLVSEVNPANPAMDAAYDVPGKTALALPDSREVFYTRRVDAMGDSRSVNIYLYRTPGTKEPYRQYRREMTPVHLGFNLGETRTYYKDALGRVWAPGNTQYQDTPGARQDGYVKTYAPRTYQTRGSVRLTPDSVLYQSGVENRQLKYAFHTAPDRSYRLSLGFAEVEDGVKPGMRRMILKVNGQPVDTIDVVALTGQPYIALERLYTVQPHRTRKSSLVVVELAPADGSAKFPRLAHISLQRLDL